jgi:hypothetical protein
MFLGPLDYSTLHWYPEVSYTHMAMNISILYLIFRATYLELEVDLFFQHDCFIIHFSILQVLVSLLCC